MKKRDLSKLAALGLLMATAGIEAGEQGSTNNGQAAAHTFLAASCGAGCNSSKPLSNNQSANTRSDRGQVADNGCAGMQQPQSTYNAQPSSSCAAMPQQQARYNNQPMNGSADQPQSGYSNQPSNGCANPSRPVEQGAYNNSNNNNYRSDNYQADASNPSPAQNQRNYGMSQGTYSSTTKTTNMTTNTAMTSDQDFMKQLNDESKKIYAGLSPEGKDLARQMASQGKEKNAAVKEAQKKMMDNQRGSMMQQQPQRTGN